MSALISEDHIEQVVLEELADLGYLYAHGGVISPEGAATEREFGEVVLRNRLAHAIARFNPQIPSDAREEALRKVLRLQHSDLAHDNHAMHLFYTEGVPVEYRVSDRLKPDKVWLFDFENPENNEFLAVNQLTIIENNQNKRPDIILFVNGLPLVVLELKNATDENATLHSAFQQLQTYKQAIPSLFRYNTLLVASDGWEAVYGSLTAPKQFFLPWKSIDGSRHADVSIPEMEVLAKGMLNKEVLLDLLQNFTLFHQEKEQITKIIPRYHQYYAVNKAIVTTKAATGENGDRRAGVVWHTQGSGKSLTMVFYAGKLVQQLNNPTLVVLTDRNDLDDQLYDTFRDSEELLRQTPVQAESREHLKTLLSVKSGGIVFTTIQKFLPEIEEKLEMSDGKSKSIYGSYELLSDRKNIVVIADEAHRSQYDFMDGFAKHMRDALPNASFIGFTGTPVEQEDRNTQAVFGNYIDVYDIQQAVEDGATVQILYENRLAKIRLLTEKKELIDEELRQVAETVEDYDEEDGSSARFDSLKSKWARLEAIVGEEKRLKLVAEDIVRHFEQRSEVMDGKAMVVCMSRRICIDLYKAIVSIRPEWHSDDDKAGVLKVIMTGSSSDAIDWQPHIRNKAARKAIGDRLKNPKDPLRMVIVRDMWLTGFDAPPLNTLYIDKPMKGHSLMQAIARVNRVYKDKTAGLVVDYIGIAQELKKALSTYTGGGGKGKPTVDLDEAAGVMMEKYEIVVGMFNEYRNFPLNDPKNNARYFDYKEFFRLGNKEKLYFPMRAADYILGLQDGENRFLKYVTELVKAFAIAVPHHFTSQIREEVALFQAIKARLVKVSRGKQTKTDEELETAIRQIMTDAIVSEEVIDIFDEAGIKKPNIAILSDEFMAEVKDMPYKNVALEMLRRLLNDEIKIRRKTNLIESKRFSDMLEAAVLRYQNNLITSAEVIEELIGLAKVIKEADRRGEDLGLDFREYAFYTALEVNDSAVKVLGDEVLKAIARELMETINKNASIDWTVRESVQAKLRVAVKRILRQHGYPPDMQAKATDTVLEQAKLMVEG